MEHRIDDLARAAGTTVRNVRAYQERGLLPPPRREGRVAYYGDTHLARLRLVATLLERGYTIGNITELLTAWERGAGIGDVLGLESAVGRLFARRTEVLDASELTARLGATSDQSLLDRAVTEGLAESRPTPSGDDSYAIPNPAMLRAVEDATVDDASTEDLLTVMGRLSADLETFAHGLVEATLGRTLHDHGPDWLPTADEIPELATLVDRMSRSGAQAVEAAFARALGEQVETVLGRTAGQLIEHLCHRAPDTATADGT